MLSEEARAKINKYNSVKGGTFERDIAKAISAYFGLEWTTSFLRTKRSVGGQPNGDLCPINEMARIWHAAKLGPLEMKNRVDWTFDQIFKNPSTCKLYQYWLKSNEDTKSENSVLFFTKPGVTSYVLHLEDVCRYGVKHLSFQVDDKCFIIQTLKDFLEINWSK